MVAQAQKVRRPFSVFCLNLFGMGGSPARADVLHHAININDLSNLPRDAQLLLAHSLARDSRELTLLHDDDDAAQLISAGWLVSAPGASIGARRFKIRPTVWGQLKKLSEQFWTDEMILELKAYRKSKSAQYPWIWS